MAASVLHIFCTVVILLSLLSAAENDVNYVDYDSCLFLQKYHCVEAIRCLEEPEVIDSCDFGSSSLIGDAGCV